MDWVSSNQLHLHQGSKSIVISDPAPFPLHVNQISRLPSPHLLVKTVSQVTIPPRTLATVPTTFNDIPQPDCHYSLMESSVPYKSQQKLFVVTVLKVFEKKCPVLLLCTIINTSSDDVVLPKN